MIDQRGFRLNVGIVIINNQGQVFWGKRRGQPNAWQFPQGGIKNYETLHEAMYRELHEEVGLQSQDVAILGMTSRWLYYRLPPHLRRHSRPHCIGQKQKWFLLKLVSEDSQIRLDAGHPPEFDQWQWIDYWQPITRVISFKREVYEKVLQEFHPLVTQQLC